MKYEVLKRSHLKRNIIIAVAIVFILSAIILTFTRAKYRTTESMPLLNGTINYTLADLNIVEMYLNGEAIDALPDGNYELTEESYCTNEKDEAITLSYDGSTKAFTVTPFNKKGTKCYLYFDEHIILAKDVILAHYSTVLTRTSFSSTVTNTTTGTIYKSANESQYDDDGEVYYFAGNPTDNWFEFGTNSSGQPLYWRIVRINGNGSIRLIYNGTSTATEGDSTMIGPAFNTSYDNNAYVGYMYESGQVHGLTTNSSIKTTLDNWYIDNLKDEYAEYLDGNAGFCGDRTSTTSSSGAPNDTGGTGLTETYYGARYRLYTNKTPTFKCSDIDNDLYTTPGSSKGNGVLIVNNSNDENYRDETPTPIGLITADEVAFAGGVYNKDNSSYYLYNKSYYWTMSPSYFNGTHASVFLVYYYGSLNNSSVTGTNGLRPVINLKSAIAITGSGTTTDPFKLVL